MEVSPLLADMQAMMAAAKGQAASLPPHPPAPSENKPAAANFGQMLESALDRINEMKIQSADTSMAFQRGDHGVELHDVMITSQKASLSFEMASQVRNKVVGAYKELMSMQV